MPKNDQINLQAWLSKLEELQKEPKDAALSTAYKNQLNLLESLNTVLSNNKVQVSPLDANRVLTICLRYTTDVRCIPDVFSIISELIDIVKDNQHVDFLPFALAILEFLNTETTTSELRILSFQVLMKHPKSTWMRLIKEHSSKVILTCHLIIKVHKGKDLPSVIEVFRLLPMLECLPQNEKTLFVEAGLCLWFNGVIPAMMLIVVSDEDVDKIEACLTYTELLVENLVLLNYSQHPCWNSLLKCIANAKVFPATIMRLLEEGKDYWHRIWIVLIKVLKNELVPNFLPYVSPLKSMLPIIETAFKKNPADKIRGFACWNALIERFDNESCTKKIIQLLIIPLQLHNTKTKETAEAKFQTWWNFIQKFRLKIQNYTNDILISFLHFMFGSGIRPQAASQLSDCLRKKCIDAFAEIIHDNGSNCAITNLNQLDGNITTTVMLTEHWNDFLYALKSSIRAVAKSYTKDTKSKIQCIWISFVMRLVSIGEDTLRHNMFDDLNNILSELILENEMCGNADLMEIIVDDITLPLWRDNKLRTLTESRSQSHRPMHRMVKLIMDDEFNNYFKRFNTEELKRLLQPLISILLDESIPKPEYIIWLLDELLVTNSTLVMWTALAQASKESTLSPEAFNKILLWPFKMVHVSFEIKEAAAVWYSLYNIVNENLEQTDFDSKIAKALTRHVEDSKASNYFVLYALIGVLKHKPDEEKMAKLEALTYEMNDYNDLEQLFIPLVDTIQFMINHSTGENLAQITINCVENILKGIRSETEAIGSKSPIQDRENTFSNLRAGSDTITSTLKTYLEKCPYRSIKKQVRSLLSLPNKTERPKKNNDVITTNKQVNIGHATVPSKFTMKNCSVCIPRIDEIMNRARTPVSKAQKNINFKLSTLQTPPTATDDIVENMTSCVAADDKSPKDNEKACLISLKTSTNKPTSKSPEKHTGENLSDLSQALEGVDNDAAPKETHDGKQNVQTTDLLTLNKPNELHKTPVKRVGAQLDVITNHKKIKYRKNEHQKEISSFDEITAVNTPVIADTDFNQTKLSAKGSVLLNDADKTRFKKDLPPNTEPSKRLTRSKVMEAKIKRNTVIAKLFKSKLKTPKTSKKNKKCSPSVNSTIIVEDSQDKAHNVSPQNVMDEPPCSENVIVSSQDSTMKTICVKAIKLTPKRLPEVVKQKLTPPITVTTSTTNTVTNLSPGPSLSLKKNRPTSGRAAQMLGLLSKSNIDIKQLPAKPGLRFNNNTKIDTTVKQNPSMNANFLELQRSLPTDTCSPTGILKRKVNEIMDDSITSPAKRKLLNFHDPQVSTVQEAITPSDETKNISLDGTPAVEIVNTSELNDTDPICPDLLDCTDPSDILAIKLSSAAMRVRQESVLHVTNADAEIQTDGIELSTKATQGTVAQVTSEQTQTEVLASANTSVQTVESGCKTTEELIDYFVSSMSEREDFLEKFKEKLSDDLVQSIAGSLSTKKMIQLIMQKPDASSKTVCLIDILKQYLIFLPPNENGPSI